MLQSTTGQLAITFLTRGLREERIAAAIAAAFAVGDYSELRGHFADRMHQPFRKKLVPFLDDVIAAAEHAGALGAFLSGSGSTICGH